MAEKAQRRITTGSLLPSLAAGGTAVALLVYLAWEAGGYFAPSHLTAGAVAFAVAGVLLLVRPPHYALSTPALVAIGSLSALAVWTGLSSHWSSAPDIALEDMQRALVYVGLFGLGLLAAGSGRYARAVVWGALGVIVVVVCAGLISRLYPDVIAAGDTVTTFDAYRLAYPLTYWNAFGALAAMGVVLAAGLAADPRQRAWGRAAAAAAAVALGVAGYLSFSRGGWLAFIIGMVVLFAAGAHRAHLLATLAVVGVPLTLAVVHLRGFPALTEDPRAGSGQLEQGHAYAPALLGCMALAAAGQWALGARSLSRVRSEAVALGRPLGLVAAVLAVLGLVGLYAFKASSVEGGTAQMLVDVEDWVDRQWDEFMTPATFSAGGSERLTSARGTRSDLYRVAFDGFEDSPLRGDGAGGFEARFAHDREVQEKVRDAHSLYFETIGELGLIGAALLVTFLGSLVAAAVLARRRASAMPRAQAGAAIAAVATWVAHTGVDWDWQMPALTGTALVLAAALFPPGRSRRRRSHR